MPFVTLELSHSVSQDKSVLNEALLEINRIVQARLNVGSVPVKSRVIRTEEFCIGDDQEFKGFVYLILECFGGRDRSLLSDLAEELLFLLRQRFARDDLQISFAVYIREIERALTAVYPCRSKPSDLANRTLANGAGISEIMPLRANSLSKR